jgi:GNAT superfamily N-acetyltransferase
MQLDTRPADPNDEDFIWDVYQRVARPSIIAARVTETWNPHREWDRFIEVFTARRAHIMLLDGAPIGWVSLEERASTTIVEHFYVHPDHEGKGYERAIWEHLLARWRARGTQAVEVTVLKGIRTHRYFGTPAVVREDEVTEVLRIALVG